MQTNNPSLHPLMALPADAPRAARVVAQLLARLRFGSLDLQWPDGSSAHFGDADGPRVQLRLRDWRVCETVLRSGDIGFAEAFIDGQWSSTDLPELLKLMLADPLCIERASHLILVIKNWERIADQATNIAEEVLFILEGRSAKHSYLQERN